MDLMRIIGVAFITTVATVIVRVTKPELAFSVTITGVLIILMYAVDAIRDVLSVFNTIALKTGVDNSLIKLLLKIVGVGYLTEFCSGIISDFGAPNVADKVGICGKITIVLLALPIFESLLSLVDAFLTLV